MLLSKHYELKNRKPDAMNVLGIISYKVFPAHMGGQKDIANFYRHLSEEANITLAVSSDNEAADFLSVQTHSFLFNHWFGFLNFIYLKRLINLIKTNKIDIIIIEHSYFGWLGYLLKVFTGKLFVIHSHNIESHRFLITGKKWWRMYEWYEKWIHQKADHNFFKCEEDLQYAIDEWNLNSNKCTVIPYGTDLSESPGKEEKKLCRNKIVQEFSLKDHYTLFYFNGTLNYAPNTDAINSIMHQLIPFLREQNFSFYIILSGNRMATELTARIKKYPEIINAGFVDDVSIYLKGVDVFINPTSIATGIKTKLVEALANDTTVISTETGARGIDKKITGNKLILIADGNDKTFALEMIKAKFNTVHIPEEFYNNFYWKNIINKALLSLRSL